MATPMPPPTHRVARPFCRAAALHLVQQGGEDPRARGADRVADGDGAAIDVDLVRIEAEFAHHARDWAANASLDSTRSRSPTFHPAFSSALRVAGIGPVPMISGSTPAWAQEAMRASGFRPRRAGFLGGHQHQRGGAVVEARGVGRGDRCRPW